MWRLSPLPAKTCATAACVNTTQYTANSQKSSPKYIYAIQSLERALERLMKNALMKNAFSKSALSSDFIKLLIKRNTCPSMQRLPRPTIYSEFSKSSPKYIYAIKSLERALLRNTCPSMQRVPRPTSRGKNRRRRSRLRCAA